jgi:hypothetical protein
MTVPRAIPVVSDVNRQTVVGVAYAVQDGDIVVLINSEKFKEQVGAMFEVTDCLQFMLGCEYIPAKKYQDMGSMEMRVRKHLIDFINNPRVLVNSPGNPNDGRKGRVYEINRNDATIRVAFESGPGSLIAWFAAHELIRIREDSDVRVVDGPPHEHNNISDCAAAGCPGVVE